MNQTSNSISKSIAHLPLLVSTALALLALPQAAMASAISVLCWGDNAYTQCTVPAAADGTVTQVAAGGYHTIALKNNGSVLCWGRNPETQCNVPATASSGVTQISGGLYHTVALKGGAVLCWGYNGDGECNVPAAANSGVIQIAGGFAHSIALKSDGSVLCWGDNTYGQRTVPTTANYGISKIAGGLRHTVALIGPPAVKGVVPASGPTTGGTNVTIMGFNLGTTTGVSVGGVAATSVLVVSSLQITATFPAHAPGLTSISITNPDGTFASPNVFFYDGVSTCPMDLDGSGQVDGGDLGLVLLEFGPCP